MTTDLEVRREVSVGLVLVGLVKVVLRKRHDEVIPVILALLRRQEAVQVLQAPVLHLLAVLLWSRDEERVHPEVEHLVLVQRGSQNVDSELTENISSHNKKKATLPYILDTECSISIE